MALGGDCLCGSDLIALLGYLFLFFFFLDIIRAALYSYRVLLGPRASIYSALGFTFELGDVTIGGK